MDCDVTAVTGCRAPWMMVPGRKVEWNRKGWPEKSTIGTWGDGC